MENFDVVEDTLFVPMLGRIYASEKFPGILYDRKALELKGRLPQKLKGQDTQSQYTLMAGAVRSVNMDRYIQDFLHRHPDGVIAQLGCGLETTFFRNDNGRNLWYEMDLPEVIAYRKRILGETDRDRCLTADAFGEEWLSEIRRKHPLAPILVTASGFFYYFAREKVLALLKRFRQDGHIEIVFDTVNGSGMKRMGKYMKQVGHADAQMYFYVDRAADLAGEVEGTLLNEEPYYAHISRKKLSLVTRVSMNVSDRFMMVKMIHLSFIR